MNSRVFKFRFVILSAVLSLSASSAIAKTIPGIPLPPLPPGVMSAIPGIPLPPLPPGVMSAIPGIPLPPLPPGVATQSA